MKWGLKFRIHSGDQFMYGQARQHAALFGISMNSPSPDAGLLSEGEIITFGNSALRVIHVPAIHQVA